MASRKINPELVLISNIVDQGDYGPVKRRTLTADVFETDEGREVFEWLRMEMADPKNKGIVPSREKLQRRFRDFYWCPDARDPIESLMQEITERHVRVGLKSMVDDLQDVLEEEGHSPARLLERIIAHSRELMIQSRDEDGLVMSQAADLLESRYRAKKEVGGLTGIPYPWPNLNRASGGMNPEEFLVIYGRPKNMKTWLAAACCAHAYDANRRVLVYSKEMSKVQMMQRTACCLFCIDYGQYLRGELSPEDEDALFGGMRYLQELEEETRTGSRQRALYFISDQGNRDGATVDALEARAETFEPDLILCDGFYHMSDGKKASKDWERVMNVSRGLKSFAQRAKIPILGTTQANREAVKGVGDETNEIAFADAIAQESDLVMRCWKGRAPDGSLALLLRMVAAREIDIPPFLIHGRPGVDFSLLQERGVDVAQFLKDKKLLDRSEEEAEQGGGGMKKGKPPVKKGANGFRV